MNPKVSVPQSLEPIKVALFGKRVFAGVIKLMILRWVGDSGLSGRPKMPSQCPSRRQAKRDLTHTEKAMWRLSSGTWRCWHGRLGLHQRSPHGSWRGKNSSSPEPLEGPQPCQYLNFSPLMLIRHLAFINCESKFPLFQATKPMALQQL